MDAAIAVRHVLEQLRKLPLPLPSLDEQCRIADFLETETARIDQLSQLLDQLA